jgi:tRNA threonylcarbamoyl adenosine modification protein YeaZ
MTALIIDTSTDRSLIAFFCKNKILGSSQKPHENQLSKYFFKEIQSLASACGISLSQLDYIAVGKGPGSYTGTRTAGATAKTLSFALNIPLIGFCSLKAFLPNRDGPFAISRKTKGGQVFVLKGTVEQQIQLDPPIQIPMDQLTDAIGPIENVCDGTDPQFNLPILASIVYEKFEKKDFSEAGSLELIYYHTP